MARTKAARLSLSMPGPIDAHSDAARELTAEMPSKPRSSSIPAHIKPKSGNPKAASERHEQDPDSSRSISPAAPFSAASEQSKSPTSPTSPAFTSLPPYPPSPDATKYGRDQSRSFFQNLKASKSSAKIQPQSTDATIRRVPQDTPLLEDATHAPPPKKSTPGFGEAIPSEPVPDIPRLDGDEGSQASIHSGISIHTIPRRPVGASISTARSSTTPAQSSIPPSPVAESHEARKNGKLFPSFMKRNHSNRPEELGQPSKPSTPTIIRPPETGSIGKPRSREHSASRNDGEDSTYHERLGLKPQQLKDQKSQSFRDGAGSTLFRGFKQQTARAAKDIGKAGNRLFRGRHASNTQTPDFSLYELKVINQPLKEQTRITRIAKRLEDSKDKTEFWMPALPWRCIDFLNFTGCETEGLYRVPGSEREVRLWKARFDQEYDINLFEEEDLYDVNTVGSLFKSWLRELPEDVFPQSIQDALSAKYSGETRAPEEVKEILSQLPPWNYYLLFAITCHLSLLHAYQEKNKMTFHNLFVCFAPALRLNGDCFRWLVGDWRACWKGCSTEKAALEAEYRVIAADFFVSDESEPSVKGHDRNIVSAGSAELTPKAEAFQSVRPQPSQSLATAKPKARPLNDQPKQGGYRSNQHSRDGSRNTSSRDGSETVPSTSGGLAIPNTHPRNASQLPELDFPQPLSPTFAASH